ncbi:MAG: TolC family protein [Candidatus Methylomirabilales bacterium]
MAALLSSGICFVLILLAPLSVAAQQKPSGKLVFNLEDAVKRTLAVSHRIKESRAGIDVSLSKKTQADAARWAQIEANLFAGPSSESDLIRQHPDIVSKSKADTPVVNGVFGRAQIRIIQPIYTFEKIASFREAAARGVEVSKAALDKTASEITVQVNQAYYGALLAKDIRAFLQSLRKDIKKSLRKAERRIEVGSPAGTLSDVYQLRSFIARLEKGIVDTEEGLKLAREALRTLMQLGEGVDFALADKHLTAAKVKFKSVADYVRTASEFRPEFVQLRQGIKAREALVDAAAADMYPAFFAAFVADVAGATNRDQSNVPIITDPLQHAYGGVVVGLNWTFDFGIKKGRIDEAQAEYMQLIHKRDFAALGIPLQVRKAYLELESATKNIRNTRTAYRNARRWLVAAVANMDLGVGDVTSLTQAFILYVEFRVENYEAIHDQRMALANLDFATGEAVKKFPVR